MCMSFFEALYTHGLIDSCRQPYFYPRFADYEHKLLKPHCASESPWGPIKTDFWACPQIPDSVGVGWGLRMYIFSKFPGGAGVAGLKAMIWDPLA